MIRRSVIVLAVALACLSTPLISPAWACGCGAYSPEDGGTATVPMETALVRVNGDGTEDIYLSLSVNSTVRTGALLFPVPDKAATVSAGPTRLFVDLARVTAPPPDRQAPGNGGNQAGAPNPGVTVVNRQQIGPLEVVTLASGDSAALTRWLQTNGFAAKPALTAAARPYTDRGWAFVAVRLRQGAETTAPLRGQLDPLRIHFQSKDVVYPMRLSAMGSRPERVQVYTLAPHRLALRSSTPGMTVTRAFPIGDLTAYPELRRVAVGEARYLTRWDGTLTPASITDDFHFSQAPADDVVGRPGNARGPDSSGDSSSHNDGPLHDMMLGLGALAVVVLLAVGLARWQTRRQPSG